MRSNRRALAGFVALVGALLTVSVPALACEVAERPIRPVRLDPAAELRAEAARLDAAASREEMNAQTREREATRLLDEARVLRQEAGRVSEIARRELLAIAGDLASRGEQARRIAREDRAEAAELRTQARLLRDRANRLVGGGGGWGIRRPVHRDLAI